MIVQGVIGKEQQINEEFETKREETGVVKCDGDTSKTNVMTEIRIN